MTNNFMDDKSNSQGLNQEITTEQQNMLNKPVIDPEGLSDDETQFIKDVMVRVYNGDINLFSPSSLINSKIYDGLQESVQGQADIHSVNFCSKLRSIKDLMEISGGDLLFVEPSFQVRNLVQSIKFEKEQFESKHGDIFVI